MRNKKPLVVICFLFFVFCSLFFVLSRPVLAGQPIEDYLFQYEKYRQANDNFTTLKDKYLKYKTLSAEEEAIQATKELINQRNYALRAYFLALIWKLRTTPGVVGNKYREDLISRLDKEVRWLDDQTEQLKSFSSPSLADLFVVSDRIEDKSKKFKLLSYQALSAVLLGKVRNLQAESVAITNLLDNEIGKAEASPAGQLKNWLREVENKNYLSQKEIVAAEANQKTLEKKSEKQLAKTYFKVQQNLEKAKEYLNQAFLFQKEILTVFKNGSRI